jgi:hypothetical protein
MTRSDTITRSMFAFAAVLAAASFSGAAEPERVFLSSLAPTEVRQGWGALGVDASVQGKRLRIGTREFDRGLGTHAASEIIYDLDGAYDRFEAWVGVDAEMDSFGKSSVEFVVLVDGAEAFRSGVMRNTTPAARAGVSVKGAAELRLIVNEGGDDISGDHADWADAVLIAARETQTPAAEEPRYEVRAPGIIVRLSSQGNVVGVVLADGKLVRGVRARTRIAGSNARGDVTAMTRPDGGVEFTRALVSTRPPRECTLRERYVPTADSVRWEIEIRGSGPPWTAAITTRLTYPDAPSRALWTAWADPDHRTTPRPPPWSDPLVFRPFANAVWTYGSVRDFVPFSGDFICMPVAMAAEPDADAALSLVLSLEDTILDLSLVTTASGTLAFTRTRHRLGGDKPVRFAMDLVGHAADCRAALGWMAKRYPRYFDPVNPQADAIAGCGAYSGDENPVDVAKLKRMAFRINWKLSDDFPYMGMFLPPLDDPDARWQRACDEPCPPNKPTWSSFRRLNDYAKYMRGQGFFVLNYFNVTEFGRKMVDRPVASAEAAADPLLWQKPLEYLKTRLPRGFIDPPIGTCYDAWVTDVGDPDYERFMLEQARRHIEKLPDTSGICIDRLDWLRLYNVHGDDGVSWVDGKPARSLCGSWRGFTAKLGPLMHGAGKVIFVNNHIKRLDLLEHVDGIYCEFCQAPPALNSTGLLCVRRPALGWTDAEATVRANSDAFFQRHLHLGVYPTAPYPGNHHCIVPSPWVDERYQEYGRLFDAMRGKKWVLVPHAVTVDADAAKANLFEVPGGYALPVTFAGKAQSVRVVVRGIAGIDERAVCEALHPASEQKVALAPRVTGAGLCLDVPVVRGCAMVTVATPGEKAAR